jgi:hypothetical protein
MNDQQEISMVLTKPSLGNVHHPALQRLLGREGNRVNDEVESPPFFSDPAKDRLQLPRNAHIERHHDRCVDLAPQRLDFFALSLR